MAVTNRKPWQEDRYMENTKLTVKYILAGAAYSDTFMYFNHMNRIIASIIDNNGIVFDFKRLPND